MAPGGHGLRRDARPLWFTRTQDHRIGLITGERELTEFTARRGRAFMRVNGSSSPFIAR